MKRLILPAGRLHIDFFLNGGFCVGVQPSSGTGKELMAARRNTDCIATGALSLGGLAGEGQPGHLA